MDCISLRDREILREIANRKLELAGSEKNGRILTKWKAQAAGKKAAPIVRLLYSNFYHEVVGTRLRCEGVGARRIESELLSSLVGRELFDDDTPLSPTYEVLLSTWAYPFARQANLTKAEKSIGFRINPVTDDIERDIDIFLHGSCGIDKKGTEAWCAYVADAIGDILPTRVVMNNLTAPMTNPLGMLLGLDHYLVALYDTPEVIHRIMDSACTFYEHYFDMLEKEHCLLPTNGISPVSQESFAFTDELPTEKAVKTTDVWGFLESQETTATSPEMYGEFVYPYMDRLVRRFGLLSYGCCERVDALWENYLSKWKNLRKLSVSPFNDIHQVGDYLKGTRIVFYSKPRAEHVTNPGPLDEEQIRAYFRDMAEASSGCLLEVAQREVGTIYGDYERGRRYVQLARETLEQYWQP